MPCDITEIVERAIRIVQTQLAAHRVELRKNLRADLPTVHADANQIQQVIVNLLLNANDAIGEGGGTITLVTNFEDEGGARNPDPEAVEISVSDTGCGIPAAQSPANLRSLLFHQGAQRVPGLGSRSHGASSKNTTDALRSRATWAKVRHFACCCRSASSRRSS